MIDQTAAVHKSGYPVARLGCASNTLGAEFCVEALEEALSRHGRPEIDTRIET